jgi:hypothetical protein
MLARTDTGLTDAISAQYQIIKIAEDSNLNLKGEIKWEL